MGVCVLIVMWLLTEKNILPILVQSRNLSTVDAVINLLFPISLLLVLGFFLVFDCILNASAELTCFADREFYQDWWNSTTYYEFARKWNRPVHEFLLRHIYSPLFKYPYNCNQKIATMLTFIYSIALHELVLTAATHQFHPWFAFFSLFQIPLIPVMSSPLIKGKQFGNIIFWAGLMLGLPLICILYARDYCKTPQHCHHID